MLNENKVLNYIKSNLGFPFMQLELDDDSIMNYIKEFTISEFSHYMPNVNRISLNTSLESVAVPGRSNEYYINDPEGREILNVADIYMDAGDWYAMGHPPYGPTSYGEMEEWALSVEMSANVKKFSNWDFTFEFRHPNIIRISPTPRNGRVVTVEYERVQSDDFSEIPNEFQRLFSELALADTMIVLGRIRGKYSDGQMRTPWGEVNIQKEIMDERKEKKREILDKLETMLIPNVIVDFG